jgi:hypothetical protein
VNTEIDFGNGLVGYRKTGALSESAISQGYVSVYSKQNVTYLRPIAINIIANNETANRPIVLGSMTAMETYYTDRSGTGATTAYPASTLILPKLTYRKDNYGVYLGFNALFSLGAVGATSFQRLDWSTMFKNDNSAPYDCAFVFKVG